MATEEESSRKPRPKITLQIPTTQSIPPRVPQTAGSSYYGQPNFHRPPGTPSSNQTNPQYNPFMNMYHSKASDFVFKQFAGFKDFTMNTAKIGLSGGEKTAFWLFNKLSQWSKKWFTHIFLFLCLLLYSLIGAAMFVALESPYEKQQLHHYNQELFLIRKDFSKRIHQMALNKVTIFRNDEELLGNITQTLAEYENLYTVCRDNHTVKEKRTWTFFNAMFFAGTVYTTIGYGHIVPSTFYGRIATIFYAIIGIPLFLIVLADFGKLFTRIIKFFWAFIRRLYYTGSCRQVRKTVPMQEMMRGLNIVYDVVRRPSQMIFEGEVNTLRRPSQDNLDEDAAPSVPQRKDSAGSPPPLPPKPGQNPTWVVGGPDIETGTPPDTPAPSAFEIDDEFNLPISVAIVILILYIFAGASIYMIWEEWTFFQSFYFVFVSMSTIGFGDLVPKHPMFMMLSILYLVFGLALTSMCINVVQVKLSDTFRQASAKIGATIGLKVDGEDGGLVPITPAGDIAPVHRPKVKNENDDRKDDVEPEISNAMKND